MDNNPTKTTTGNKALMIIGGGASGKTLLVKRMMDKYYINEVAYCNANPLELDKGVLPWELITGSFPKKMIVVEGITAFDHVMAIIDHIKALYEPKGIHLPEIMFTCQYEKGLGMHKLPRQLVSDTIEVVRLDEANGTGRCKS